MFAKYVVALVAGKIVPYLISPKNNHPSWDQPPVNLREIEQILGAGFISWDGGKDAQVTCFGKGTFSNWGTGELSTHESRGDVDAEIFRGLLSQPIPYIVLKLSGQERPVFVQPGDTPDRAVARYQVYASRAVVSAGLVDFGLGTATASTCFGEETFNKVHGYVCAATFTSKSRGGTDLALMEQHFKQ